MRKAFVSLIACLALMAGSCNRDQQRPQAVMEASGCLGETSIGDVNERYRISAPYWQKGNRMVVVGYAEHPARQPDQPSFIMIVRLPANPNIHGGGNSVVSDGEKSSWSYQFPRQSGNRPFTVAYELKHKPLGEQLTLDKKEYPLESGRLILLDLAGESMQVTQLNADRFLKELNPNRYSGSVATGNFEEIVQRLSAQHEKVRALWQDAP